MFHALFISTSILLATLLSVESASSAPKIIYPKVEYETVTFQWKIANFLEKKGKRPGDSPAFDGPNGTVWHLELFPNGYGTDPQSNGFLSILLHLDKAPADKNLIFAWFSIFLESSSSLASYSLKWKLTAFSTDRANAWGVRQFISREDIKSHLDDGALTINCEVNVVVDAIEASDSIQPSFYENMEKLCESNKLADLTIKCPDGVVKTSKTLLSAQSPVFAKMLKANSKVKKELKIDDFNKTVMAELVRYATCGKVENLDTVGTELLIAADTYEMKGLKDLAEQKLINMLDKSNVCEYMLAADKHKADGLMKASVTFIRKRRVDITQIDGWYDMLINNRELAAELIG